MENFVDKEKIKENIDYIAYSVLYQDLPNITNQCNNYCLTDFMSNTFNQQEITCLENCSKKLIDLNISMMNIIKDYR